MLRQSSSLLFLPIALLLAAAPVAAQRPDSSAVSLDALFAGDYVPERFGPTRWLDDSTYTTLELEADGITTSLVRYDAASGRRSVLVPGQRLMAKGAKGPLDVEEYSWSPDHRMLLVFTNSRRVWRQNTRGDFWVYDLDRNSLRKLGGDAPPSSLMFAKFSPDSRRVAYVREHDLYVERLSDGAITRLTKDGSVTIINGTFDWVYEEELNDRDGFRWSPDGAHIAFWQLDASGVRDYRLIDDTDSLYSFVKPVQYPKAGTTNSAARIGVVSASGGPTKWLEIDGDPRQQYLATMEWAASPNEVAIQRLNRLQNKLDVLLGDIRTGKVKTVITERDSAWVDVVHDLRWLDGGKRFTWVSERDGWRHLYVIMRDGSSTRLVTPGPYDLTNPNSAFGDPFVEGTDERGGWIYFNASPDNPTQLYLYRTRLDSAGTAERVTPKSEAGTHTYDIAPGAQWAFHTFSNTETPPVTELVHLPDHRVVRTLVGNKALRARVAALRRRPMEFFKVDGGNGLELDAWLMTPPDFDPSRRYPLLIYVYGEPAGQTVRDEWDIDGTYFWHLMLTQRGYLVASVDNEGTPSPRGRTWRKSIYRQIGVLATQQQAASARAIAKRSYVDSTRIGVWGWSGGGSMTLNLLFRSPDLYRMGMAVAPVSDLRYYDTIYQERYMGLPQENGDDYRRGSPITYAANLKGDLLLVHGSGDDNVHFQNSEALINALVAANKPFTMMDYPNRSHCICEGPNTTRHLFELLTRYLGEHLGAPERKEPQATKAADASK